MSAPSITCPGWCDARSHANGDRLHVAPALVHRALVDDVDVSVAIQANPDGEVTIGLGLVHLLSAWPGGAPVEAEVTLLPCEAEMLAHRLLALVATAQAAR